MSCNTCGCKCHSARECRQPKKERGKRPCFTCGKSGHEARNCSDKVATAARRDACLVEDGKPAGKVAVFAITGKDSEGYTTLTKGPRRQEIQLGDLVANSDRQQHRPTDNKKKQVKSKNACNSAFLAGFRGILAGFRWILAGFRGILAGLCGFLALGLTAAVVQDSFR